MTSSDKPKPLALTDLWQAAIDAVNGQATVRHYLQEHLQGDLQENQHNYTYLIAIGKAASAMSLGALELMSESFKQALIITKYGHVDAALANLANTRIIEAGHPIADQQSLLAGQTLVGFVSSIPAEGRVLFLISGGASALVEILPPGFSLDRWQNLNRDLLASGKNISDINQLRKAISCIKDGKLAQLFNGQQVSALYLSDVPNDQLDLIGSGLLCAQTRPMLDEQYPELRAFMTMAPDPQSACFNTIKNTIIASNATACHRVEELGRQHGYRTFWDKKILEGDINTVAKNIANDITRGPPGIYIWGGETTVTLPKKPGKGGRNQALGLLLAEKISGQSDICILVAGTDGTDGPTDAAGAIVDGSTLNKGRALAMDESSYIQGANAYPYLQATACLFNSGPTGTNVMDIVIAIKG